MPLDNPLLQLHLYRLTPPPLSAYIFKGRRIALPERMAFVGSPAMLASLQQIKHLCLSDCYRSPRASLTAFKEDQARSPSRRKGVAYPGASAHNYARAVDVDTGYMMKKLGIRKKALDDLFLDYGFRCFRDDHLLGKESWHYTFGATTGGAGGVEALLDREFDRSFSLPRVCRLLGISSGTTPAFEEAVRGFQKREGLPQTGVLNTRDFRALLILTAQTTITQ